MESSPEANYLNSSHKSSSAGIFFRRESENNKMNIKTEACMDFDDNMAWGDDLDDGNEDEKDKTKERPKILWIMWVLIAI